MLFPETHLKLKDGKLNNKIIEKSKEVGQIKKRTNLESDVLMWTLS